MTSLPSNCKTHGAVYSRLVSLPALIGSCMRVSANPWSKRAAQYFWKSLIGHTLFHCGYIFSRTTAARCFATETVRSNFSINFVIAVLLGWLWISKRSRKLRNVLTRFHNKYTFLVYIALHSWNVKTSQWILSKIFRISVTVVPTIKNVLSGDETRFYQFL